MGIIAAALLSQIAFGMTEGEFQRRSLALKKSQTQTDLLLKSMGIRSEDTHPEGNPGQGSSEKERPLFQVHQPLSTTRIPFGKLLFGRTLNRLVVGSEGAPVLIQLDPDQGALSGLRVVGLAKHSGVEGRLNLELSSLSFRSGRRVPLVGSGLDPQGAYGIEAQVFSGKALSVLGAVASSFISGLAASQQTQELSPLGFSSNAPTGRNALLQGVAQSAADQSKRLIDEATAEKPILVSSEDTPVTILVQEEVRF